MIHDTQSAQISQTQYEHNIYIYVIMKKMCPPGYHHNGFQNYICKHNKKEARQEKTCYFIISKVKIYREIFVMIKHDFLKTKSYYKLK